LRADDNSAFGANFDFIVYPKAAATWVVSEEPFWTLSFLNSLKLRAAWGRAGQQPDAFAAESTYVPVPGGTVTPFNVGNPDLKPERGEELELGMDAGLWHDRIGISATYFDRRTRDAIVAHQVTPSRGFPGTQLVNLAAVRNNGVELAVDARLLDHPGLAWDLGFIFSTNDSRVESLGGLPPIVVTRTGAQLQEHREGYPLASFFYRVIVHAERAANGQVVNILCDGGPGNQAMPCDSAPRLFNGQPTPRWQGSVRATLTIVRNLRLYGLVDFKGGHLVNSATLGASLQSGGAGANARVLYDSSDVIHMAYEREVQRGVPFLRGFGFMNGGFAKLREVSATYSLPNTWAARVGAAYGTITLAGRNLATLWVAQRTVFGRRVVDPEQHFGDAEPEFSSFVRAVLPQYAQGVLTVRLMF
jgi:outer membrane receptor protein involved in Fe transport